MATAEKTDLFEIQNKNMKRTSQSVSTFYETNAEGETFEYTLEEDTWHKTATEGKLTAAYVRQTLVGALESTTWTAVDASGKLSGTARLGQAPFNQVAATATYHKENNTVTLNVSNQTVSVYNVNATSVTLPQTDTPQPLPRSLKSPLKILKR